MAQVRILDLPLNLLCLDPQCTCTRMAGLGPPTCVRLSQAVGALKPVPASGMPNAPVACMGMVWACGAWIGGRAQCRNSLVKAGIRERTMDAMQRLPTGKTRRLH